MGSDFSQSLFENCSFNDCNLSNALVDNTKFQTCHFENCKIVGVDFSPISPILLSACFSKSNLDLCIFMEVDLRKLSFSECHITESQFINANLKEVAFEYCDLSHSLFEDCNLEAADFSTAKSYVFSPESNRIRQAVFSLPEVLRFLEPLDIIIK
ncbi:MAG: pentapeptide repeat-containing protein [Saprospiraceae bacterium]|nr:pentapeptide repeat-containing protein [Saprospiraceae bacterium]